MALCVKNKYYYITVALLKHFLFILLLLFENWLCKNDVYEIPNIRLLLSNTAKITGSNIVIVILNLIILSTVLSGAIYTKFPICETSI